MEISKEGKCRISFDGEMLGGIVGQYSLVEIGACTIEPVDTMKSFGVLIKPERAKYDYGAMKVLRRPFKEFVEEGIHAVDAAHKFITFLHEIAKGREIEIICVNSGYDFGFIKEFLGTYAPDTTDLIGFKAYDIVPYACGAFGVPLGSMSTSRAWKLLENLPQIYKKYFPGKVTHSASQDAIDQAKLLLALEELNRVRVQANEGG